MTDSNSKPSNHPKIQHHILKYPIRKENKAPCETEAKPMM